MIIKVGGVLVNDKKDINSEVLRYASNMFAFPDGYFETHNSEELKISEEARLLLIKIQRKNKSKRGG